MNQEFIKTKSQSGVKCKKPGVKKNSSTKNKNVQPKEKKYRCLTCKFATSNRKDYRRHLETKKHTANEEKKQLFEQEVIKRVFWKKHTPAICRNGCEYKRGEKYFDCDGINNPNWLCEKCYEEECQRVFGFSKKPPIENVIIDHF
jgi:hypothetical protein